MVERLHKTPQIAESGIDPDVSFAFPRKQRRQVFRSVRVSSVGRVKANALRGVLFQEEPNAPSKNGPYQDVGVQNDHVSRQRLFSRGAIV